jgi:hypothetical protein
LEGLEFLARIVVEVDDGAILKNLKGDEGHFRWVVGVSNEVELSILKRLKI